MMDRCECKHPEAYITADYYGTYGIYCYDCNSYWVIIDKSELPPELQNINTKTFVEIVLKELQSTIKMQTVEGLQARYPELFPKKI